MLQYTEPTQSTTDDEQKKIFLELAEMECEHKAKIKTSFVDIDHPEFW